MFYFACRSQTRLWITCLFGARAYRNLWVIITLIFNMYAWLKEHCRNDILETHTHTPKEKN